jgi:hypothetical protein
MLLQCGLFVEVVGTPHELLALLVAVAGGAVINRCLADLWSVRTVA